MFEKLLSDFLYIVLALLGLCQVQTTQKVCKHARNLQLQKVRTIVKTRHHGVMHGIQFQTFQTSGYLGSTTLCCRVHYYSEQCVVKLSVLLTGVLVSVCYY